MPCRKMKFCFLRLQWVSLEQYRRPKAEVRARWRTEVKQEQEGQNYLQGLRVGFLQCSPTHVCFLQWRGACTHHKRFHLLSSPLPLLWHIWFPICPSSDERSLIWNISYFSFQACCIIWRLFFRSELQSGHTFEIFWRKVPTQNVVCPFPATDPLSSSSSLLLVAYFQYFISISDFQHR